LFWEMSLGKTIVTLNYLNVMIYELGEIRRALVIGPDKVVNAGWPDEIDKYYHLENMKYCVLEGTIDERLALLSSDADVFFITEGTVAWLIDLYIYEHVTRTGRTHGDWRGCLPFDCIVIDELSKWKKQGGARYKKLRRAIDHSDIPYRVGLTGTPIPNGWQNLWGQLYLIDDGARLGVNEGDFVAKYFTTRGNGMIKYSWTPRPGALEAISALISDICDSRKTRAHIPLPPMYIMDHELTLPPFERELYEALEKEFVLELARVGSDALVTVKTPADLSNKLLQVSSGAIYEDRVAKTDAHIWHELHTIKTEAVYQLLNYYDENFILVYQFAHEKERILKLFPWARELRRGKKAREDVREWNEGKIKLLVGHPASMGHGLNMQFGGRRQIWWGPTWNLEHWLQTLMRILRRDAADDVYIHRFIMKGTRDVNVKRRVFIKESDQDFLYNEVKELKNKHNAAIRAQQGQKI
jgi:SNF2 family DNA or RNA helicase